MNHSIDPAKAPKKASTERWKAFFATRGGAGLECERCRGRMRLDSTSEKNRVGRMISGKPTVILPMTPGTNSIGANAAMVVNTPNVTGTST